MTARTHDAIAFASLVSVATFFPLARLNILTLFSCLVANVIGGILPDIDQATNRLWLMLPEGNTVAKYLRNIFLNHRTITHSLLGLFLAYEFFQWLLARLLNPQYIDARLVFWSLMIGIISHLCADAITKEGVPLLFPLQWKFGFPPIKALRVTTGSWVESYLVLPGVGAYLLWFIWSNQVQLLHLLGSLTIS